METNIDILSLKQIITMCQNNRFFQVSICFTIWFLLYCFFQMVIETSFTQIRLDKKRVIDQLFYCILVYLKFENYSEFLLLTAENRQKSNNFHRNSVLSEPHSNQNFEAIGHIGLFFIVLLLFLSNALFCESYYQKQSSKNHKKPTRLFAPAFKNLFISLY